MRIVEKHTPIVSEFVQFGRFKSSISFAASSLNQKLNYLFLKSGDSAIRFVLVFTLACFSCMLNAQQRIERQFSSAASTSDALEQQVDSNLLTPKFVHFDLRLNQSVNRDAVYKAIDYFPRIELYRMVDRRRIIRLSENLGEVELYSSKELYETTGRSIRPQNIKSEADIKDVEFYFSNQGYIKEILK